MTILFPAGPAAHPVKQFLFCFLQKIMAKKNYDKKSHEIYFKFFSTVNCIRSCNFKQNNWIFVEI